MFLRKIFWYVSKERDYFEKSFMCIKMWDSSFSDMHCICKGRGCGRFSVVCIKGGEILVPLYLKILSMCQKGG